MSKGYKETLNEFKTSGLNITTILIAEEMECFIQENINDDEFEQLCGFAEKVYLKYESLSATDICWLIAKQLSDGHSVKDILNIKSKDFVRKLVE